MLHRFKIFTDTVRQKGFIGFFRWYWEEADNRFLGLWVNLRGNVVRVGGLEFSVNTPAISTAQKSQFVQQRYERPERNLVQKYLSPDASVIELGGFIGVVSCTINKRLSHPEQHLVVEANPQIIPLLQANRDRNHCKFTILNKAIAYGASYVTFNQRGMMSSIHAIDTPSGSVQVETITLSTLLDGLDSKPVSLICDIEGAEIDLVKHESELIANCVDLLVMETHPFIVAPDDIQAMCNTLQQNGFEQVFAELYTYAFLNKKYRKG